MRPHEIGITAHLQSPIRRLTSLPHCVPRVKQSGRASPWRHPVRRGKSRIAPSFSLVLPESSAVPIRVSFSPARRRPEIGYALLEAGTSSTVVTVFRGAWCGVRIPAGLPDRFSAARPEIIAAVASLVEAAEAELVGRQRPGGLQ